MRHGNSEGDISYLANVTSVGDIAYSVRFIGLEDINHPGAGLLTTETYTRKKEDGGIYPATKFTALLSDPREDALAYPLALRESDPIESGRFVKVFLPTKGGKILGVSKPCLHPGHSRRRLASWPTDRRRCDSPVLLRLLEEIRAANRK